LKSANDRGDPFATTTNCFSLASPVETDQQKQIDEISSDHLHVDLLGRILRDADKDAKNSNVRDETKLENHSRQKMVKSVKFKLPVVTQNSPKLSVLSKKTSFIPKTGNVSSQLYTNKFLASGQRTRSSTHGYQVY
jgi:hypothetical protein